MAETEPKPVELRRYADLLEKANAVRGQTWGGQADSEVKLTWRWGASTDWYAVLQPEVERLVASRLGDLLDEAAAIVIARTDAARDALFGNGERQVSDG